MLTRTTTQLISDLRDPANTAAWSGFDARYRPILASFARKLGFAADDAAELAQQTLVEFAKSYQAGRYQRGQGRLSSWLIGIAHHVASAMRRRRGKAALLAGATVLGDLAASADDQAELADIWTKERQRAIIAEAMTLLRQSPRMDASTIAAFELFAIRGVPAPEVAAQCNIAVDSVYTIKHRLTNRLREIVADLTAAYDEGE